MKFLKKLKSLFKIGAKRRQIEWQIVHMEAPSQDRNCEAKEIPYHEQFMIDRIGKTEFAREYSPDFLEATREFFKTQRKGNALIWLLNEEGRTLEGTFVKKVLSRENL